MSNLAITSAPLLTGVNTASGDLFPLVDVSASAGSKGSAITRDELGDAMTRTAAMIAALAAKLDKAGGTMTGVLTAAAGAVGAPGLNFGDASTGIYKNATNGLALTFNGTKRWDFDASGTLNSYGAPIVVGSYAVATNLYSRSNGLNLFMGTSDDLLLQRAAAASLQLGSNHATTATAQTIKAHHVTTGTGADLILAGGTGSWAGGSVSLAASVTTGAPVKGVEVMPSGQIAFFGTSGSGQVNTGIAGESHSPGSGTAVTEDSTFGGYTIMQIVAGLRALGLFN